MTPDKQIQKLVEALRDTPNWKKESYGNWKDSVTTYDRSPFKAADALEALLAENNRHMEALEALERIKRKKSRYTDNPFNDKDLADLGAAVYDIIRGLEYAEEVK